MQPFSHDEQCFLCQPDRDLIYSSDDQGFALAGLGPIVKGYSVVASREHIASTADLSNNAASTFLNFALETRAFLTKTFGSCLMTEHGRLPVCVDVSGTTDTHCFHAHFLLFPGVGSVGQKAEEFFAKASHATNLIEALVIAREHQEYFLLSPTPDQYIVLTRPGRLIRQFARFLVADFVGAPERANWRKYPGHLEACAIARELKESLETRE